MKILIALIALSLAAPVAPVSAAKVERWWQAGPQLPKLTGRVVDNAELLTAGQRARLTRRLTNLEASTRHQFVIVTIPSLNGQEIEAFGLRLGRTWGA